MIGFSSGVSRHASIPTIAVTTEQQILKEDKQADKTAENQADKPTENQAEKPIQFVNCYTKHFENSFYKGKLHLIQEFKL